MSSVFRIIETFFFISLAITFLLVLLLVFHFKMRLLTLEEKHDTTLEIINNIVGELQYIKKSGNNEQEFKKVNIMVEPINGGNGYIFDDKKVFVSEGEESDEESDEEIDEESDEEGSDDESIVDESYDKGSDDSGHEDAIEIKIVKLNSDVEVPILEVVVKKEGHDELSGVIDVIVSKKEDSPDNYEGTDYDSDVDDDNIDMIEVGNANLIVYATHKPIEKKIDDITILDNEEPIIPDIPEFDVSIEDVDDIVLDSNMDDYRKLNVQSLKSIAISKGLSADPSKMKKKELLNLLA